LRVGLTPSGENSRWDVAAPKCRVGVLTVKSRRPGKRARITVEKEKKIIKTKKNTKLLASLRLRCSLEKKPHKGLSPIGMTIPGDGLQIGSPGLDTKRKKKFE
jgi:hypothetical protein